jgi:hypothetical protein
MMILKIIFLLILFKSNECNNNIKLQKPKSNYIVNWHAPFYSGGGYSSEALSFASSLILNNVSTIITHHGDSYNKDFIQGLTTNELQLLHSLDSSVSLLSNNNNQISICHSEPGAW